MKWNFIAQLKDYCANCTLTGFSYIANDRIWLFLVSLHIIERIFWVICVVVSAYGSYYVIDQYQKDFQSSEVSIVYETISPFEKVHFPTVSVCDLYNKYELDTKIEEYVAGMAECGKSCYNFDVELHIAFILYPYFYHDNVIKSRCLEYDNCQGQCAKCPTNEYRGILENFGVNCSNFFVGCSLANRPFDCCEYFLPLITPVGNCFLLNSLQNNVRNSPTWFDTSLDLSMDEPLLSIRSRRAMQVSVLNEEDIPHYALPAVKLDVMQKGQKKVLHFSIEHLVNDAEVRNVPPERRQCRFSDELLPHTVYRAYSFSSCLADCLRINQIRLCNCTAYSLLPEPMNKYRECDLDGYYCLEHNNLVKRDAKLLLPWVPSEESCTCLPSCTENDIASVYESNVEQADSKDEVQMNVVMSNWPGERYRRQALRSRLDIVVFIGGILGLFLGASLLSGLEFIYYFTIRWWNNNRITS